jgi:hypothetical protein
MATTVRRIWLCVNTIVFGGGLTHRAQLVRIAKAAVEEFHEVGTKGENSTHNRTKMDVSLLWCEQN